MMKLARRQANAFVHRRFSGALPISSVLLLLCLFCLPLESLAGQLVRTDSGSDEITLLTSDLNEVDFSIEMSLHADDPCKCDLKLAMDKLRYLTNFESRLEQLMGSYSQSLNRQWNSVLQQAAQNAQAIEPNSTASVAMQGVFNTLVAYGTQKFGDSYGQYTSATANNLIGSAAGGLPGALQKIVDAKTAKRIQNNIPALATLDDLLSDLPRWLRLQDKLRKTKKKLWDALEGSACIKALGKLCGKKGECTLSGLDEKSRNRFKHASPLGDMRTAANDIMRTAKREIDGKCCNICAVLSAMKQLDELKAMTGERVKELSEGVRKSLETQISLNQDLHKWLSRKGALSGDGYQALSAAMGFIPTPWAGVTLAAAEGVVNIFDSMITQDTSDSLKGNIRQVAKNLKELREVLQNWKDFYDDLARKQADLMKNALENCRFKIPCDDASAMAPDRSEPATDVGDGFPLIGDSSEWCSYFPWETPGGFFTPDGTYVPPGEYVPGEPYTPGGGIYIPPTGTPTGETPPPCKYDKQCDDGMICREGDGICVPEEFITSTPPPVYVKAKQEVVEGGKSSSKPVVGAQFKLTSLAPGLPVDGNKKVDKGFDQDPVMGRTGEDGTLRLGAAGKVSSSDASPGWLEKVGGIPEAVAAGKGEPSTIEVTMPAFKSYIVRIKVNRNKKNWQQPATYLGDKAAKHVIRSWLAGDILYAVVNVPAKGGKQ